MEKIILIHCSLIGLIIVILFYVLLSGSDKNTRAEDTLSVTDKWLAIGTVLLVLLVVHLNWLVLPLNHSSIASELTTAAFYLIGFLVLLFAVQLYRQSRKQENGKRISWRTPEGKRVNWRLHSHNWDKATAFHSSPNDKKAG